MSNTLLEGVTVVEYSRSVAGPYCGMLLADMGARVIRVEPLSGDETRKRGPLLNDESLFFATLNRNKESIAIDIGSLGGAKIMTELLKKADIFIENFDPGYLPDLGFSYEAVKEANPKIVYLSISGYGQYGPCRDMKYSELFAQAMGGLMASSGEPDGYPARMGGYYAESTAGTIGASGVLGAYYQTLSGEDGQYVDLSLVGSMLEICSTYHFTYFADGKVTPRPGNYDNISLPFGIYKCKDGYVAIAIIAYPMMYWGVVNAIERPELFEDERFQTGGSRKANQDEFNEIMYEWLSEHTIDETLAAFTENNVSCCRVNTIEDIVNDPHIGGDRDMFPEYDDPVMGPVRVTGTPIKIIGEEFSISKNPPALGEDTDSILLDICGLSDAEIEALKTEKAIA